MKKFSLLGVCLLGAFALSAQTDVVKEVEHMLKESKPDYPAAAKKIAPALTDETTKNDPLAWKLAGQIGEGLWDDASIQAALGTQLTNEQKKTAGHGLLDCYVSYLKAIPLDYTVDKKGKKKVGKLVKGMVKSLNENYNSLTNAGVYLFEAQDFGGAYDVWEMYITLPDNPVLGKDAPKAPADTVKGQIMYFQMLTALSGNENAKALAKVEPIINSGYKNIETYVYGIEAARRLNDTVAMLDLAEKGYRLYGTKNVSFVGQIINDRLSKNDFAGCKKYVNEAIAATAPNDSAILSQLYDIMGLVCEQDSDIVAAKENIEKAIALDPKVGKNYYDMGRLVYNEAVKVDESTENEVERTAKVKPLLLKAAEYFEKGYKIDPDNLPKVPGLLYRLYYRLGDGYQEQADYWKNM